MQNGILHFAHANGFPAGTYAKLLGLLKHDYAVMAIEKLGHNPSYPVDDNWVSLTKELVDHIESNAGEPVIGVGHSLGGVLTFLAAYRRPELFREVIMLDPALAYGPAALFFSLAKRLGLVDRVKVVARTKKRRTQWSSRQEAEAHFKQKEPFSRFDPDCLRDYVQYGTIASETGVKLSFDVNAEVNIFKTTPDNLGCLRRKLGVPGAIIVGERSPSSARHMASSFARAHSLHLGQCSDGSHLFPLEYPERTATLIRETIERLEALRRT